MNLFFRYLRQRRRQLSVTIFCFGIFLCSFALYHLPIGAVLYPALLCIIIEFVFWILDFFSVRRLHVRLSRIGTMTDLVAQTIPTAQEMKDEDYQRIIRLLGEEHVVYQSEMNRRYDAMIDYYTAWAHQIKTPIASMRLHLQSEDSDLSRRLLSDLCRIERYVDMVLTFVRLESDSTDYVFREIDLDEIVKSVLKKLSSEFIARKLKLVYEPSGIRITTDEKWLSFVIEQVLSNALKYTPSGQITVFVKNKTTLCIQDTGIGIASEDLPRIFENGYTGGNGRTDYRASGIGLYLCKRICNNLGHRITASSVPDEGTVIEIDLAQRKPEVE